MYLYIHVFKRNIKKYTHHNFYVVDVSTYVWDINKCASIQTSKFFILNLTSNIILYMMEFGISPLTISNVLQSQQVSFLH